MKKKTFVFLSYSRQDDDLASELEQHLKALKLPTWRDVGSINAGEDFASAIEQGVRDARAVVTLVTPSSVDSDWVLYEYGLATGARIPIVAVLAKGASLPRPLARFQAIGYTTADQVARKIEAGIAAQSRKFGEMQASAAPELVAKFQETNGKPDQAQGGTLPQYRIETWLVNTPGETDKVAFAILDNGFTDPKWTVRRSSAEGAVRRDFLTDQMSSYGDIEIWGRGFGSGVGSWAGSWTLHDALMRYYGGRSYGPEVGKALKQIEDH